jgi:hypothetical protein
MINYPIEVLCNPPANPTDATAGPSYHSKVMSFGQFMVKAVTVELKGLSRYFIETPDMMTLHQLPDVKDRIIAVRQFRYLMNQVQSAAKNAEFNEEYAKKFHQLADRAEEHFAELISWVP